MENIKMFTRRVCAYIIDLFIVLLVSTIISNIPFINKDMKDYQKTYDEYEEKYNNYADYNQLLKDSYNDELIAEEEYQELIKNDLYKELIESKYDDQTISKEEYDNIVEETKTKFDSVAEDYVYLLSKKSVTSSLITLICVLLYFGVMQFFLKGETIGKKLFKLKVVSANDEKITVLNYLLRSLIVNEVLFNIISILSLVFATRAVYTKIDNVISILLSIVEGLIIFLVIYREDGRGLHDLLFNTKVISTEDTPQNKKIKKEGSK